MKKQTGNMYPAEFVEWLKDYAEAQLESIGDNFKWKTMIDGHITKLMTTEEIYNLWLKKINPNEMKTKTELQTELLNIVKKCLRGMVSSDEDWERLEEIELALSEIKSTYFEENQKDYKAKYDKCIAVIKRFDPRIISMYDL